jgi:mannopine transport system permease protein
VWLVVLFIMVPTLIIVPMSFSPADFLEFPPSGFTLHWYAEFFDDLQWRKAAAAEPAGGRAHHAVLGADRHHGVLRHRARHRALRSATQLLVIGPVIAPHIAVAVACYLFYQQLGIVGSLGGFVAAHTVLALPFVVFTVSAR